MWLPQRTHPSCGAPSVVPESLPDGPRPVHLPQQGFARPNLLNWTRGEKKRPQVNQYQFTKVWSWRSGDRYHALVWPLWTAKEHGQGRDAALLGFYVPGTDSPR
ncbi:uncharacterized protein LOC108040431 isoform X2 [Drosophila rhopaloa]|uniref:Uncharacterized protein LOC108040431 isoform X2 n=1 Tax=Drosophila rhopaloa TaxID=1041015 RepID=A0A6P4EJJ6_DRORH|nr:uncharacterized protein LOC108040431 isoform X2 [Drosophila rhopaloa]